VSTEQAIYDSFRKLVIANGFHKIAVSDICRNANVSRKSFYAHFLDKEDLLEKTIYEDIIHPVIDIRRLVQTENFRSAPRLVPEIMYRALLENREFYSKLFAHGGQQYFSEACIKVISAYNQKILNKNLTSEVTSGAAVADAKESNANNFLAVELDYKAYFFAAANTMLLIKWIRDGWRLSPNQLARYFDKWALSNWVAQKQT
jgi:AcrR family transcriptional regulator